MQTPHTISQPYILQLCSSSKCLDSHSLRLYFSHPPTQLEALSSLIAMVGFVLRVFTLSYFILFYFSLVILSHSLLHYIIHYVATVKKKQQNISSI